MQQQTHTQQQHEGKIIPFGYNCDSALTKLERLMTDKQAYLVDIRLHPLSNWHRDFNKAALQKRFPKQYVHMPELGNLHHHLSDRNKGVKIANLELGISRLVKALSQGWTLILMCICTHQDCHKWTVIQSLKQVMPSVQIITESQALLAYQQRQRQESLGTIRYHLGSIFQSDAQVLVNTVNCKGVMGKGLALAFRQQYPDMFPVYQRDCREGRLRIGRPTLYKASSPWILNFPTKDDWRTPSKLEDIEKGLQYFTLHYKAANIQSIAFPQLGTQNGKLSWQKVRPLMERYLSQLDIPVSIYIPSH